MKYICWCNLPVLFVLVTLLCVVVFVNPDGYTGFGTPWEIAFLANYTILTKSGNIGGYSSFFTVVPDLLLGKRMRKTLLFFK